MSFNQKLHLAELKAQHAKALFNRAKKLEEQQAPRKEILKAYAKAAAADKAAAAAYRDLF